MENIISALKKKQSTTLTCAAEFWEWKYEHEASPKVLLGVCPAFLMNSVLLQEECSFAHFGLDQITREVRAQEEQIDEKCPFSKASSVDSGPQLFTITLYNIGKG